MLTRLSDWYDWPFGSVGRSASTLDQLRRQMERVFTDFEDQYGATAWPRMSLDDDGANLVLRAEVPGMAEQNLEITANATTLTLRGQRQDDVPEGYTVHRKERSAVQFARSFQLPTKIDPDNVQATIKNGVLTLKLPKAAEARPKQISIKAS
jgi:HSP20 family protein